MSRYANSLVFSLAILSACSPVQPWQRGILAKPHMSLDPAPLEQHIHQHVHESREAAGGGLGAGGGGCGCK